MEFVRLAENLATFVDVARAGSFSAVARRRGQAASSVARQIDALEREMGAALFTRSTRALALTEAGDLLFDKAAKILKDISETRDEVASLNDGVAGRLRIACLPAFGRQHVVPHLESLYAKYPALSIELELTERVVDPVLERLDLVIRVGNQADSQLIAKPLASHRHIVCATPGYLLAHGVVSRAEDLNEHRLIDRGHSTSMRGWREILTPSQVASATFAIECDDCDARRLSVLQGLGIALLPDWSVGEDIQKGRLVELQPEGLQPQKESAIYLLRAAPRATAKFKAFCNHLSDSIGTPPYWQVPTTCTETARLDISG